MKQINFINTVSPQAHAALRRWCMLSGLALVMIITSFCIMRWHQHTTATHLKERTQQLAQQTAKFTKNLTTKSNLTEQHTSLTQQLAIIKEFKKNMQQRFSHATLLRTIVGTHSVIDSVQLTPKKFELKIHCPGAQEAIKCAQNLKNSCNNVRLVHLQPDAKNSTYPYVATIAGSFKS